MQTFLPSKSFRRSARALDRQRLGKQRVEGMQILRALSTAAPKGWRNHPAVLMWRHHARSLGAYVLAVIDEWERRGYVDNCRPQVLRLLRRNRWRFPQHRGHPPWLGSIKFHRAHRVALLCKSKIAQRAGKESHADHYAKQRWTDRLPRDPRYEYVWPAQPE